MDRTTMKKYLLIFIYLFLTFIPDPSYASTYYIDQSGGSDDNPGTRPDTPWKHCPGMTSYTGSGSLKPGDTVYFDSADTWLVTGTQGLFMVGGVKYIGDSWGNGKRAEIRAMTSLDAGVIRFSDHDTYETVFKGFNVNANNQVASGIDINHRYSSKMTGATKRVENCEVHHVWSRKAMGQYKYGIIISNWGGKDGIVENVELIGCTVHDISRDAICLYPGDRDADCRIKNILVRGCEAFNTGQDPDYTAGAGLVVKGYVLDAFLEYNYFHHVHGAGIFVNGNESNHFGVGPTNIHIRHNIVDNPNTHGGIHIYDKGGDPKDIKIYGNIILNNQSAGGLTLWKNSGNLNLLVYNNTFYNASVRFTEHTSPVNNLEFKNNIVYSENATPLVANSGDIKKHASNIYYRSTGTLVSIGTSNYTAGNLHLFEPSASSKNPMFQNVSDIPAGFSGTYGFDLAPDKSGLSLRKDSYGIDNGESIGSSFHGSVNTQIRPSGRRWDIGAYEYPDRQPLRLPDPGSDM